MPASEKIILRVKVPFGRLLLYAAMRYFILIAFFPVALASQTVTVMPDRYLDDRRGFMAPTPVFTINKNDTSLFGAGQMPKFRLPKAKGQSGFVFMGCAYAPASYPLRRQGLVLVYFTHIGEPDMRAYVDRNFNGDYTDDGESRLDGNGQLTVAFADPAHPGVEMRMQYRMLSSVKHPADSILTGIFGNNLYYAGATLKAPALWLAAEQLWIKGCDIVIGRDSMCILFCDRNEDGCFTGTNDMIALLPYGSDSAYTTPSKGMRSLAPGMILGFNGKAYEINYDSTQCGAASIRARPDLLPPVDLSAGDPLPHLPVMFFSDDSSDIYTAMRPGTYLYIEFWGTWCGTCRMIIPTLKALNDTLGDRLTIVSLDVYDDRAKAKNFVSENEMRWVHAFSDATTEKLLFGNDQYPYGVLVDPQGRIVAFDVSPQQVAEIVSKQ